LEIGPGEGALTEKLLPLVEKLAVIEIDPLLIRHLQERPDFRDVHIIHGDVLFLELPTLPFPLPVRVMGNIPYNITSPILFWLIEQRAHWSDAYLMMQKEVAERLTAPVGSKTYGRLTVMVRAFLDAEVQFTIPPEVFIPRPRVESAIVRFTPKSEVLVTPDRFDRFEKVVAAAFGQRRKMLRNSLKGFNIPEAVQEEIDFTRRPETLTLAEFVKLSEPAII
ncbi:MAG: ribosomal RNA small subunit methyltransferase A, partial [FCB group bacterium]|nr:ribosomal RNA small subunit methyltransferase A [FCB group bacterium]